MSADWIVAAATVGAFIVIAASAIAALVQLRHMRQSNQIAALNEARETIDSPEFRELMRFIRAELPARLQDPAVRRSFLGRSCFRDVPENLRLFVKNGIIDGEITCELRSQVVVVIPTETIHAACGAARACM